MPPIPKKDKGGQRDSVRLVAPNVTGDHRGSLTLSGPPPSVRLATGVGPPGAFANGMRKPDGEYNPEDLPALLVSYFYYEQFKQNRPKYHFRDWVMDSGAFSAHNSGAVIDLKAYIDCCKELMATDPQLTEVFALDVIGDWKGTLKNTEKMWKAGVPAIPCFHYGEPWDVLLGYAKDYPKIALGGCVGRRDKDKFAQQCFARVWPKKIHGFGFGAERSLMLLPWHSVDATNWEIGPCKFGRWASFGNASISVRGSQQNLRAEVEWYLDLERRTRVKWKKEMKQLADLAPTVRLVAPDHRVKEAVQGSLESQAPTVRLDGEPNAAGGQRAISALGGPTVRLVAGADGDRPQSKEHAFRPTEGQ